MSLLRPPPARPRGQVWQPHRNVRPPRQSWPRRLPRHSRRRLRQRQRRLQRQPRRRWQRPRPSRCAELPNGLGCPVATADRSQLLPANLQDSIEAARKAMAEQNAAVEAAAQDSAAAAIEQQAAELRAVAEAEVEERRQSLIAAKEEAEAEVEAAHAAAKVRGEAEAAALMQAAAKKEQAAAKAAQAAAAAAAEAAEMEASAEAAATKAAEAEAAAVAEAEAAAVEAEAAALDRIAARAAAAAEVEQEIEAAQQVAAEEEAAATAEESEAEESEAESEGDAYEMTMDFKEMAAEAVRTGFRGHLDSPRRAPARVGEPLIIDVLRCFARQAEGQDRRTMRVERVSTVAEVGPDLPPPTVASCAARSNSCLQLAGGHLPCRWPKTPKTRRTRPLLDRTRTRTSRPRSAGPRRLPRPGPNRAPCRSLHPSGRRGPVVSVPIRAACFSAAGPLAIHCRACRGGWRKRNCVGTVGTGGRAGALKTGMRQPANRHAKAMPEPASTRSTRTTRSRRPMGGANN